MQDSISMLSHSRPVVSPAQKPAEERRKNRPWCIERRDIHRLARTRRSRRSAAFARQRAGRRELGNAKYTVRLNRRDASTGGPRNRPCAPGCAFVEFRARVASESMSDVHGPCDTPDAAVVPVW
jgi:hypothetical protein